MKEDYTSVSRIVEFLPGETQEQIMVEINNDKRIERNETFELYLIAGADVHLSLPRTEVTIENDDGIHYMHANKAGCIIFFTSAVANSK